MKQNGFRKDRKKKQEIGIIYAWDIITIDEYRFEEYFQSLFIS